MSTQYNHYGPLCAGCGGNNLKDRSARQVVRYNWIEGGNRQMVHYGGDGRVRNFRKGTLFFYNNTLVSTRTLLDVYGVLDLSHNWIKPGWVKSFGNFKGTVNNDGTMVEGPSPGFVGEAVQDYHLASGSAAIDAGTTLNPLVLPDNDVLGPGRSCAGLPALRGAPALGGEADERAAA